MNFLITAIGSMSAASVISSIREYYPDSKIIGTDINPAEWHWISTKVDVFYRMPKASSDFFIRDLIDICRKEKIDIVLPLTDPEVDILSGKISYFISEGIKVGISQSRTIRVVRDKYLMAQYFAKSHEIKIIPTYKYSQLNIENVKYPLIAKRNNGRSSEGLRIVECMEDLKALKSKSSDYIFQPKLVGSIITVDFVRDEIGNVVSVSRVENLRTANGAGLSVEVIHDEKIDLISQFLATRLNILGCMNYELIKDNDKYYLMDINPRFSAGVSFSKLAGYDFVYNSIQAFLGNSIQMRNSIKKIKAFKKYEDIIL